jgi:hypothetical protein
VDPNGKWLVQTGIGIAVAYGIYSAWKSYNGAEKFACSYSKATDNNARYGELMDKFMREPLTSQEAQEFQQRDRERAANVIQAVSDSTTVARNAITGTFAAGRGVAAEAAGAAVRGAGKSLGTAVGGASGCNK